MIKRFRSYDVARTTGVSYLTRLLRSAKVPRRQLAVHFDIDGTLLDESKEYKKKGTEYLAPITPIVELLKWCRMQGLFVVIITARPNNKATVDWTRDNLKQQGIGYDMLLFLQNHDDPETFKSKVKKQLSEFKKLKFIMSVGDRMVDVDGPYAGFGIKLPEAA